MLIIGMEGEGEVGGGGVGIVEKLAVADREGFGVGGASPVPVLGKAQAVNSRVVPSQGALTDSGVNHITYPGLATSLFQIHDQDIIRLATGVILAVTLHASIFRDQVKPGGDGHRSRRNRYRPADQNHKEDQLSPALNQISRL